jgi:hypothetical protein
MSAERAEPVKAWDEAFAAQLIGATVLIGMTCMRPDGEIDRREQMFGLVVEADSKAGILVDLDGTRKGTSYRLPPQTSVFQRAERGTYALKSTGETVNDPDFTCAWILEGPKQ